MRTHSQAQQISTQETRRKSTVPPEQFEANLKSIDEEFNRRKEIYLEAQIDHFDLEFARNPQHVSEFTREIMKHYLTREKVNQPQVKNMNHQPHITDKMRSILIDWIIEVHQQLRKLKTESLFLTINLIDRFLEKRVVT